MVKKVLVFLKEIVLIYLKRVVPVTFIVGIMAGLSFFVWKPFTYTNLSERLVWAGIGFMLVTGILVFGQTSGGRDFGTPGQFITTAHARTLTDWNIEIRKNIVDRFDFRFRFFLVGLTLLGIGALVDVLFV